MLALRLSPRRCPRASSLTCSTCTRRCRRPAAARSATPPARPLPRAHMHAHTRPPAAPPARHRTPRSLGSNKIGAAGAAALAKALPTSKLTNLEYVHAPLPPPCRCPHGCDSGCWHHPCALRLRPLLAPCRHPAPTTHARHAPPHCRAAIATIISAGSAALGRTRRAAPRGRCATRGVPSTVTRRSSAVTVT